MKNLPSQRQDSLIKGSSPEFGGGSRFGGLFCAEIRCNKPFMQSIGERLEEARKRKGVTIREAAESTKIRGDYLNSFENNNFNINVPDIYVRGFLRSYCNFLKVNSEKIITDYNAQLLGEAKASKREHREFFGRMELQQPLVSEEPRDPATIEAEPGRRDEPEEERRGGLSAYLENIDKEVAVKVGVVAVAALLLILVIVWAFGAIVGGDAPATAQQPSPTDMQPAAANQQVETMRLIATGDVRVSVIDRNTGRAILSNHPMTAGQSEEITLRGPVRIEYTQGENLLVEYRGTEYETNVTGAGYNTIAPQQ